MASGGLRFKDKVAIVTGGCQGIGNGCVNVFVKNGGKVAIFDIDETKGKDLVGKCGNGEIYFIQCDTTSEDQIKTAVQRAVEHYGQIDCLVNNAGWHPPPMTIEETSVKEFNDLLQLNLTGYFMCCKYTLPYLRKTKGSIVNISSVSKAGQRQAVAYVASKGAVSAMTKAIAFDEAKYGVRVNAVSPGATITPLYESLMGEQADSFKESGLLGRPAQPEEIGEAVLYLAAEGTYCTATDLSATAGSDLGGWR